MMKWKTISKMLMCGMLVMACTGCQMEKENPEETITLTAKESTLPVCDWQLAASFPDWKGYTDDTLALNSSCSFFGCHGQGKLYVQKAAETEDFRMYVNGIAVDTKKIPSGGVGEVDISAAAINGLNTVQISNIRPIGLADAVQLYVDYPVVLEGTPEEEGIDAQSLQLISDLVESDIANGFTSAQMAVVRNGRLVYQNAWGKTNAYLPDGTPNTKSAEVTNDTLYDLASLTKMFTVNYALQKLVTDGAINLDEKIADHFGKAFVEDTMLDPLKKESEQASLKEMKEWKGKLTIRDLLRHQGGFPADTRNCAPSLYVANLPEGESYPDNPFFAGNAGDEATKRATEAMLCRTPLEYEPGTKTVYSDLDYMFLGLIVEKVTGEDLDTWMKKNFYEPMGLTHITYNPLKNGFSKEDCAATELNGNTRDHLLDFEGYRTYTLQGEVHDEKAFYSMAGISGHAGLFANATDLAKLASVMLSGGYGEHRFFSRNVMDLFTAPKSETAGNWGLGWWRQGDGQRTWYYGTQAVSDTIGHQGWTGTLAMVDPGRNLVVIYLTNKINSPVTDNKVNANEFDGNWYTASTLGFVPQILSIGMDSDIDQTELLLDLTADMAISSLKLVPEGAGKDHPSVRNCVSKLALFEKEASAWGIDGFKDQADALRRQLEEAFADLPR